MYAPRGAVNPTVVKIDPFRLTWTCGGAVDGSISISAAGVSTKDVSGWTSERRFETCSLCREPARESCPPSFVQDCRDSALVAEALGCCMGAAALSPIRYSNCSTRCATETGTTDVVAGGGVSGGVSGGVVDRVTGIVCRGERIRGGRAAEAPSSITLRVEVTVGGQSVSWHGAQYGFPSSFPLTKGSAPRPRTVSQCVHRKQSW